MSKVVPELLPCPFCGALPTVAEWPNGFEIQCVNHKCAIDSGPVAEHRLLDEAAAAWNTRTPTPPPATPVEGAGDARLDGMEAWLRKEAKMVNEETPFADSEDYPTPPGDKYRDIADAINNLRVVVRLSDRMITELRATVSQQAAEMERLERTVDRLSAYNENETVSNAVHNAVVARIATLESALAACRTGAAMTKRTPMTVMLESADYLARYAAEIKDSNSRVEVGGKLAWMDKEEEAEHADLLSLAKALRKMARTKT